jgi:hypothetical protein
MKILVKTFFLISLLFVIPSIQAADISAPDIQTVNSACNTLNTTVIILGIVSIVSLVLGLVYEHHKQIVIRYHLKNP